jgi:hypothetical protein
MRCPKAQAAMSTIVCSHLLLNRFILEPLELLGMAVAMPRSSLSSTLLRDRRVRCFLGRADAQSKLDPHPPSSTLAWPQFLPSRVSLLGARARARASPSPTNVTKDKVDPDIILPKAQSYSIFLAATALVQQLPALVIRRVIQGCHSDSLG